MQEKDFPLNKLENRILAILTTFDSWIFKEREFESLLRYKKESYQKLLKRKNSGRLTYLAKKEYKRTTCGKVMLYMSNIRDLAKEI